MLCFCKTWTKWLCNLYLRHADAGDKEIPSYRDGIFFLALVLAREGPHWAALCSSSPSCKFPWCIGSPWVAAPSLKTIQQPVTLSGLVRLELVFSWVRGLPNVSVGNSRNFLLTWSPIPQLDVKFTSPSKSLRAVANPEVLIVSLTFFPQRILSGSFIL